MLSLERLRSVFETLLDAYVDGIQGVIEFESAVPGPTVGITICTHGNEPCGLAVADYLLNYFATESVLRGKVYVVLNNIEATRRYLSATNQREEQLSRYVDLNMNRLPLHLLATDDNRYELVRGRELKKIWGKFTTSMDIHSMTSVAEPMIISKGKQFGGIAPLIKGFGIETLISNIDEVQLNAPIISLYGGDDFPSFAIEAGQHTSSETVERSIECAMLLLRNTGVIDYKPTVKNASTYKEYVIESSVMFPDLSFDFVKDFRSYDVIKKDQLLAIGANGKNMRAPFDGHIIFPTERRGAEKDITEEVAFLSRPVTYREVS